MIDGNKRLGWQATAVFLWIKGQDVLAPEDDAFDLVIAVASGSTSDVEKIAGQLRDWSVARDYA